MFTKYDATFLERVWRSGFVSQDELPLLWQRLETRGVNILDLGSARVLRDSTQASLTTIR